MSQRLLRIVCGFAALVTVFVGVALAAPVPQPGFVEEPVLGLENIEQPTAIAFTPAGQMLIATQLGKLLLYQNGALLPTPALDLTTSNRVCTNSERGMLGIAVDPQFTTNRYIYVFYTFNKFGNVASQCKTNRDRNETDLPVNRVSRFVLDAANNTARDEFILLDNIPSPAGNHNSGDLHFGNDGYLYISTGDGGRQYDDYTNGSGSNEAARDQFILLGKILRLTRDGGIPPGNPFVGSDSARCYDPAPGGNKTARTDAGKKCQETFAWGLRNPFRLAFDPNAAGTRFFINDVGWGSREELNEGQAGADYGWNCLEGTLVNNSAGGKCKPTPANMTPPVFEYGRSGIFAGCASITSGAFVPNGVWPSQYDNSYLFGDYACGKLFLLKRNGSSYSASTFLTSLGANSIVHMTFGPYEGTQALYYTTFLDGIRRVRLNTNNGTNRPPSAELAANPVFGAAPLTVNFNGSASSDPDSGDRITAYLWDFGVSGATRETSGPTTSFTYDSPGTYTAALRVRDSRGASSSAKTIRIDVGNTPPTVNLMTPAAGAQFVAGQNFTLQGSASDAQDGALPPGSLRWDVRQHHDEHFHPYLSNVTGNNIALTAPSPEDLFAATNSYLEVRLTATDAQGLTTVVTRELRPRIVNLTFRTEPAGLNVVVDGGTENNTVTGPAVVASWPGYVLELNVPVGQSLAGEAMQFCGWSQGGAAQQELTTPGVNWTYTAVFAPASGPCTQVTPGPTPPPDPSPTPEPSPQPGPPPPQVFVPITMK